MTRVVPAKAGTITPNACWRHLCRSSPSLQRSSVVMGPGLRRGDRCVRGDSSLRPLHGRLLRRMFGAAEILRGVDQRDMRQGLREIAGLAFRLRVVLLREQAEVI